MILFKVEFECISSCNGWGLSILDMFAKCLFKVWALSSGCISTESLFLSGGGGFLLVFKLEISFAILYHCFGGVLGSARFDLSFWRQFALVSRIKVITSFLLFLLLFS